MNKVIILKLIDVNKSYGIREEEKILKGINLNIYKGDFISIIGKSGSGKSTLLNIIGNLDIPTDGKILFKNKNISNYTNDERADFRNENIGFIFQSHLLLPEFTVVENILIPNWIKNKNVSDKLKEKTEKLLEEVDLKGYETRKVEELSGGERQRVAIVRALINEPDIVLADEPTGNLDSYSTLVIYNLLKKINEKYKTTFIIVTHDNEIADMCQRKIEIKDGLIKES